MKRYLLALSLSLMGFGGAQNVQVSGAPAVNFNVLPDGAIWVKPGLYKVPNYNGTGVTLWIEVSGASVPLTDQWKALNGLTPVTVSAPMTSAAAFKPVTVTPVAPPVTVSAEPVKATLPTTAQAAPAPAAQTPVTQVPVTPAPAAQVPAAQAPAVTTPTPTLQAATPAQATPAVAVAPATVITTRKDAAELTAASRALPATTPTRVALMAADKGVVSGTLPAWLNAQVFVAPGKEPGTLTLGYTFTNTDGTLALITDPTRLTVKQGDRLLPGRLDRRNTSQQVGYLGPKTGEFGTVTVSDAAAEPVTFTWAFVGTAGEGEYTLSVTWSLAERTVRSN